MKKLIIFLTVLFFALSLASPKLALADPADSVCSVTFPSGREVRPGNTIWVTVEPLECGCWYDHRWYHLYLFGPNEEEVIGCSKEKQEIDLLCDGGLLCKVSDDNKWRFGIQAPSTNGIYKIEIHPYRCITLGQGREKILCSGNFTVSDNAPPQQPPPEEHKGIPYDLCQGNEECEKCISKGGRYREGGSWTALGCIPSEPNQFIAWILARAMEIGGGVAFILIILGAFQIITSSGDPDKVKAGKEMITAAISGLLLIIFSLFLLQLIGVKILNIPGFGQ